MKCYTCIYGKSQAPHKCATCKKLNDLWQLAQRYANAKVQMSWAGSGELEETPQIERQLQASKDKLQKTIREALDA